MKKFFSFILILCAFSLTLTLPACAGDGEDISSYSIFAIFDEENSTLTGTVDFTYYNDTDNEIGDLKFNLFGNAFREGAQHSPVSEIYKNKAYYDGASWGGMTVSNVENCSSWNIGGEDENILTVTLLTPIYPEDTVDLTISYTLTLAKINHRTGVTKTTVNLGNFYPILCPYSIEGFIESEYYYCGDPFVSACANYDVTIDLPADYTAAASGRPVFENEANGRKKCAYTLDNARDFALVLSKNFSIASGAVGDIAVNYYYTTDKNAQVSLAAAVESLKFFCDTFGEYEYPVLSVVQTGFVYGGMEYPALTMISDSLDSDNTVYTIVHENAHQWWYAMVGSDQLNDAWQDEGLAEYSTLMFFENNPTYGFTRTGIVKSATEYYRAFFTVYSQLKGEVNTGMHRHLSEYSSELEYNNITYNKGLVLFDMLRNSIGDDKFCQCLKIYFKENKRKIAKPENLYSAFMRCGTDIEGLFDAFVEGRIII